MTSNAVIAIVRHRKYCPLSAQPKSHTFVFYETLYEMICKLMTYHDFPPEALIVFRLAYINLNFKVLPDINQSFFLKMGQLMPN